MSNTRTYKRLVGVLLLLAGSLCTLAQSDSTHLSSTVLNNRRKDGTRIYSDSAIYQGMSLKYDLGSTLVALAISKAKVQTYEIGMNWRLKQRFYPALELGYTMAEGSVTKGHYMGQGGFGRVGLDINGLKKHPERLNALLVGVRIGTALQQYDLTQVSVTPSYWNEIPHTTDFINQFRCDAWGEVVMGCQVQVWEGFQMGWYARLKILMTRTNKDSGAMPYYIPGYGYRDDMSWGLNYYIGWMF